MTHYLRTVEKLSISGYCKINIHSCLNLQICKINLTRHRCARDHCDWRWFGEMNFSSDRRQIDATTSRLWRMNLPNATVADQLATFVADFLSYLIQNWGTVVFPPAMRSVVSEGCDCAVRELSCVWQCSRDLRERLRNQSETWIRNNTQKSDESPERMRGIYKDYEDLEGLVREKASASFARGGYKCDIIG